MMKLIIPTKNLPGIHKALTNRRGNLGITVQSAPAFRSLFTIASTDVKSPSLTSSNALLWSCPRIFLAQY